MKRSFFAAFVAAVFALPALAQTYTLQFTSQPTAVVAPATFGVTVDVIDDVTGLPATPVTPFTVTISSLGAGNVLGTTSLLANAPTLTFTGLSYNRLERASLRASAPGVTAATTPLIDFDRAQVEVVFPATLSVNTQVDLPLTFKSMLNPTQSVSVTNLPVQLWKRAGSGNLQGTTPRVVSGASAVIPRVAYDQWDTLQVEVVTPFSKARGVIQMSVQLASTTTHVFFIANKPTDLPMLVRNSIGDNVPVTRNFLWAITSGVTVVQQGSVSVANDSAFVVPIPALASGSYTLFVAPVSGVCAPFGILVDPLSDYPGPVLTLRPARVGTPYTDTVTGVVTGVPTSYDVGSGALPPGLVLDPVTGTISGTPTRPGTAKFQIVGRLGPVSRPMRCTLSVFTPNETEIVSGQNFGFTGATPPYTATVVSETGVAPGNTFDNNNPTFWTRTWYPTQVASITKPMPLLVLHHGRGFDHTEYGDVLSRIAAWGFVCVSSGDYYSFFGNTQPGLSSTQPYETAFAEGGMESASGTQERLIRRMIVRNRTVGDVLFGKIDESRLFVAGHSRGGGAIHAASSRGFNFKLAVSGTQIPVAETTGLAGYIGLMPFDLWYFPACQPPAIPSVPAGIGAQPYNIAKAQKRIPGLIFASELDGDLIYPICDQLAERRSTSTCFLTIWGGNHNNTGDSHPPDATSSITALTQRNILVQWMTAFLLRYGYDRLDLDGHLYGPEYAQSSAVGRVGFRDMSAPLMVVDAQGVSAATNTLGLANVFSAGITATHSDPYPAMGSLAVAAPRSMRLAFTTTATLKTFRTTVSAVGLDVRKKRKLIFEIRQSGGTATQGFTWCKVGARLTDINNGTALVSIYDSAALPPSTFLPVYPIPGHSTARPLNRFLQVEVPLSSFAGVDLAQLASITLEFTNTTTANNMLIDDLRIE